MADTGLDMVLLIAGVDTGGAPASGNSADSTLLTADSTLVKADAT